MLSYMQECYALGIARNKIIAKGWVQIEKWMFKSPSGTCHDLSAANLDALDVIERMEIS